MGLYIKGIEMPASDKMLYIKIYPNGKVAIDMDLECKQIAIAVPVPPHGRLIDADALPNKDVYDQNWREYGYSQYVINAAPTIIPAEEAYGQYTDTAENFHWCGTHNLQLCRKENRMNDLISRRKAIEAVEKESQIDGAYGYMDTKSIVDLLNDLPSVQPEQKHGRWVKYKNWYACSECGNEMFFAGTYDESQHYCYNCGARMDGGTECD